MTKTVSHRLHSLHALRGFDMFWIAGGSMMFHALAKGSDAGWIQWISTQCTHAEWNGFRFFDLIFPLFLFISGVSFPFSLASRRGKGQTNARIYRHIIQRGFLLVIIGLNPITIYDAQAGMINFRSTGQYFFGGLISKLNPDVQEFWNAAIYFLVSWLFLYFLYRKKIFLRV